MDNDDLKQFQVMCIGTSCLCVVAIASHYLWRFFVYLGAGKGISIFLVTIIVCMVFMILAGRQREIQLKREAEEQDG